MKTVETIEGIRKIITKHTIGRAKQKEGQLYYIDKRAAKTEVSYYLREQLDQSDITYDYYTNILDLAFRLAHYRADIYNIDRIDTVLSAYQARVEDHPKARAITLSDMIHKAIDLQEHSLNYISTSLDTPYTTIGDIVEDPILLIDSILSILNAK